MTWNYVTSPHDQYLETAILDFLHFNPSPPDCFMEFCKLTLTFESVDEILWCDHSNETSSAVLSHGTIYLVCSSNFWVCGRNPMMWPFKWKLSARTFTWRYLFPTILENEIRKFGRNFPLATFGSERVKRWYKPSCVQAPSKFTRFGWYPTFVIISSSLYRSRISSVVADSAD